LAQRNATAAADIPSALDSAAASNASALVRYRPSKLLRLGGQSPRERISLIVNRGVDLISDALPFGRLWYGEPNAVGNAIGYAKHRSRSPL